MDALRHIAGRLWSFYVDQWPQLLQSLAVAFALAAGVLLAELALLGWERSSLRRLVGLSNSARTDLLAFLLVETSAGLFIGMAMLFGVTYGLQRLVGAGADWTGKLSLPLATATAVYFVLVDLASYWSHRLCHTVPLLWEIHRYHHSAPEMTVFTAARDHPMERAFSALLVAVPAAFVAMPAADFVVVHMLAKLVGLFKHSNLCSNWGWFGRYVVQSPGAHRIHHSLEPQHHNKNFASLFQFWDVLFGTAVHPTREAAARVSLGVKGDDGQAPPLAYLLHIFMAAWRRVLGLRHV